MSNVTAVVPTSLVKSKAFNFVFLHQAGFNYNGEAYGFLIFENGQWRTLVIKNSGIVAGGNTTEQTITALSKEDLPDFAILVEPGDFESAKRVLTSAGHKVTKHPHDGPLAMSGRA